MKMHTGNGKNLFIQGKAHFPDLRKKSSLDPSVHQRCFKDYPQSFHPPEDGRQRRWAKQLFSFLGRWQNLGEVAYMKLIRMSQDTHFCPVCFPAKPGHSGWRGWDALSWWVIPDPCPESQGNDSERASSISTVNPAVRAVRSLIRGFAQD